MTLASLSLRTRLTLIILLPLMFISTLVGIWQFNIASETASEVFDRSLLAAALAVSNDVSISGGDALSESTRDILADTSGGLVYYHVFAPDGVIVAGYATPPVGIPTNLEQRASPSYFNARYLGQDVNGVRLQMRSEIDGFAGIFTTTVWQESAVRDAFLADLQARSLFTISALIASVAFVVWFGVRLGLSPLLGLREAIDRRSSDELSPIRRPVPDELKGIVATLNRLLGQVSRSMTAQSDFISNAAHQLRNPIAGVLSLAEAVVAAKGEDETKKRARELLVSARTAADLSNKLLKIERMKSANAHQFYQEVDLFDSLRTWLPDFEQLAWPDIHVSLECSGRAPTLYCDATMVHEALVNLVDNARKHGGSDISAIWIDGNELPDAVEITVSDNGVGIREEEIPKAVERFSQLPSGSNTGSGLGLTLVQTVAQAHQGEIVLSQRHPGLSVTLSLPLQQSAH